MTSVLKHELRTHFHTLSTWLFMAFLLIFVGIGAMLYNIQSAVANFEYVLKFVCIGLVVIIPVLTMRVFAEEKKQKTDQLLYALPLSASGIVLGKYFALLVIFLIPTAIIAVYPLIFSKFGEVYLLGSYGSMLAFFIMGASLIAVGVFISSLTENQGFAAGIAIVLFLLNYFSVRLSEYISTGVAGTIIALAVLLLALAAIVYVLTKNSNAAYGTAAIGAVGLIVVYLVDKSKLENLLPALMSKLSFFERFYGFVDGVFDIGSIVFYLTVIIFFLFLTVQSLEKRRYN
ncbi:MAG: ABC transporter permease subunit [Lachnospiraceae bacterium]|nr:ABC transporter permease subunit [Lachnospiraceae bacterium]